MYLQKEAYLMAYDRRQKLAKIEAERHIRNALNGRTPPLLAKAQNGWNMLKQVRSIRIHVTFDLNEAPARA
ncbi:MAG: hypothetical protein GY803_19200 [Chloroflexi bacterium]|nr:hypothetical protein [Chloroflexota bacterium]